MKYQVTPQTMFAVLENLDANENIIWLGKVQTENQNFSQRQKRPLRVITAQTIVECLFKIMLSKKTEFQTYVLRQTDVDLLMARL